VGRWTLQTHYYIPRRYRDLKSPKAPSYLRLTDFRSTEYPTKAPKCKFTPALFHPNVYPSGTVCLSILNEDEGWKPAITLKDILQGIQMMLDEPDPESPAQADAYSLFKKDIGAYREKIRKIVKDNPGP